MTAWTTPSWVLLALVHLAPASALIAPTALRSLYGIEPADDVGILMQHRGALFLSLVVLSLWAGVDPAVRRTASVVVAISVVGFLALYVRAGLPPGPLRRVAIVDALALVPLVLAAYSAWLVPETST